MLEPIKEKFNENSLMTEESAKSEEEIGMIELVVKKVEVKKSPKIAAIDNDVLLSEPDFNIGDFDEASSTGIVNNLIQANLSTTKLTTFDPLTVSTTYNPLTNSPGSSSNRALLESKLQSQKFKNLESQLISYNLENLPASLTPIIEPEIIPNKTKKSFLEYNPKWKKYFINILCTFVLVTSYFIISIYYMFTYIDNILAIIKNSEAFDRRIVLSSNELISMNLLLLYNITNLRAEGLISDLNQSSQDTLTQSNDFDITSLFNNVFTNEKNYTSIMKDFTSTSTLYQKYNIYEHNQNCNYLSDTLGISYILEKCDDYKIANGINFEILNTNKFNEFISTKDEIKSIKL